ncbi:uncharacterized protein LOC126654984 [Mercurialis annua]|uniref:uncharacterized protein LOC126654984 n=1 Tax=Mercurialis annua TaxID=3986 RepID=UPI0024AD70CE|nr:uncharacterized protein LOC126654984 [Mercurialis annua]
MARTRSIKGKDVIVSQDAVDDSTSLNVRHGDYVAHMVRNIEKDNLHLQGKVSDDIPSGFEKQQTPTRENFEPRLVETLDILSKAMMEMKQSQTMIDKKQFDMECYLAELIVAVKLSSHDGDVPEAVNRAKQDPNRLGGQASGGVKEIGSTSHVSISNSPFDERYVPPHKRDELVHFNFFKINNQTSRNSRSFNAGANHPPKYDPEERNQPLPHQPVARPLDMEAVREPVQELYGPGLRQIDRPQFHKPYPDHIDRKNPYPRGYKIPIFSLFSGEDGHSAIEHVAKFTIQCGVLANLDNIANFKLRLFPNSLTCTAFTWYATLPRNSVLTWAEMERLFHTQFYRVESDLYYRII